MLPTLVPAALDQTGADLRAAQARALRCVEALLARRLHHLEYNGDGAVRRLIDSDVTSLQGWATSARSCAEALGQLRTAAVARLAWLAEVDGRVRAALTGPDVTAATVETVSRISRLTDNGWCSTMSTTGGTAVLPVTGDPAWATIWVLLS